MDDLTFTDMHTLQVEFGDLNLEETPSGVWELNQLAMKPSGEETA